MTDLAQLVVLACAGTAAVALASGAALKGWQAWLEVRRLQARTARSGGGALRESGARELSALKQRVRRLEAIADGRGR